MDSEAFKQSLQLNRINEIKANREIMLLSREILTKLP